MKTIIYNLLTALLTALRNRCKPPARKKRFCCLCMAQIKRADRWHYGPTGYPMHWFCEIPTTVPLHLRKITGAIPDAEPVAMDLSCPPPSTDAIDAIETTETISYDEQENMVIL